MALECSQRYRNQPEKKNAPASAGAEIERRKHHDAQTLDSQRQL